MGPVKSVTRFWCFGACFSPMVPNLSGHTAGSPFVHLVCVCVHLLRYRDRSSFFLCLRLFIFFPSFTISLSLSFLSLREKCNARKATRKRRFLFFFFFFLFIMCGLHLFLEWPGTDCQTFSLIQNENRWSVNPDARYQN